MWLHGVAGAGKSAIARSIAGWFSNKGDLVGVSSARGSTTGRDDQRRLVSTLAYQVVMYLPHGLMLPRQFLVIVPLFHRLRIYLSTLSGSLRVWFHLRPMLSPRLFIIDGLDERRDADVPCLILKVFAAAMKSITSTFPKALDRQSIRDTPFS